MVDSISEQDGVKYYTVTFTEYGNQETVRLTLTVRFVIVKGPADCQLIGATVWQVTESGLRNEDGSPLGAGGAPAAPAAPPGGVDLAALLQAKASALKTPDLTNISEQQETNIVDAIQNALSSRRQGMCYSVYGQDTGNQDWEDDDDSWMDF